MPTYLLLALLAAIFYTLGGLLNKQAMAQGCGPLRIFVVQAWFGALLLTPALFRGEPVPLHIWWQPAVTALCWFCSYTLYVYTLRDGDLSIIGPVAGIKPVFNAMLIAGLLHVQVPVTTWVACGLAAVALFVMRTPSSRNSHSFTRSALQTLTAVFFLALADLCIQRWAAAWGVLRFAAFVFLGGAVLSLSLIPTFGKKYRDFAPVTRRLFIIGAFLACLPGICLSFSIGKFGHGAEVNVVYSLHVVFTLLIVWFFGRHIGNQEHTVGHSVFLRRLAGALILLAAIVLIIFGSVL